jgi:exopolysaccharide production protein ExoY
MFELPSGPRLASVLFSNNNNLEISDHSDAEAGLSRPRSSLENSGQSRSQELSCRVLDVVGAVILLIVFAPIIIFAAASVWFEDGGSVIFRHRRIGRDGRDFDCLKFRTMKHDSATLLAEMLAHSPALRDEWNANHKFRNDPRVTGVGRILRKLSLDEFPQLFNILRGDMSLVGPRPIVRAEAKRYGVHFAEYCSVRPGLTGLWQVSGRSDTTYEERIALDRAYVSKKSFMLNVILILKTVPAILMSRGAF